MFFQFVFILMYALTLENKMETRRDTSSSYFSGFSAVALAVLSQVSVGLTGVDVTAPFKPGPVSSGESKKSDKKTKKDEVIILAEEFGKPAESVSDKNDLQMVVYIPHEEKGFVLQGEGNLGIPEAEFDVPISSAIVLHGNAMNAEDALNKPKKMYSDPLDYIRDHNQGLDNIRKLVGDVKVDSNWYDIKKYTYAKQYEALAQQRFEEIQKACPLQLKEMQELLKHKIFTVSTGMGDRVVENQFTLEEMPKILVRKIKDAKADKAAADPDDKLLQSEYNSVIKDLEAKKKAVEDWIKVVKDPRTNLQKFADATIQLATVAKIVVEAAVRVTGLVIGGIVGALVYAASLAWTYMLKPILQAGKDGLVFVSDKTRNAYYGVCNSCKNTLEDATEYMHDRSFVNNAYKHHPQSDRWEDKVCQKMTAEDKKVLLEAVIATHIYDPELKSEKVDYHMDMMKKYGKELPDMETLQGLVDAEKTKLSGNRLSGLVEQKASMQEKKDNLEKIMIRLDKNGKHLGGDEYDHIKTVWVGLKEDIGRITKEIRKLESSKPEVSNTHSDEMKKGRSMFSLFKDKPEVDKDRKPVDDNPLKP